ncbi:DUF3180 domain-containing protein [Bifidobacterium aquikefiri]|uniref:DUF3180 domain-containing protein n=1 Tax=Bifidobacterium aquikefiri TaxID=1653207 RepID=A0A261G703_9BIFI|nr:DUF3180 domain-containing protein [Bifidobacterium aquikefiri]OZG67192.1 hypothetical protein BAQU_1265 [Bifidobacterium aquikefiri]
MKARRTPWWYYLVAVIVGAAAGFAMSALTQASQFSLMGAPWVVPVLLVALGAYVFYEAYQVHLYVKGDRDDLDPIRAVNTLVISKALALAGAALAGWYGMQLIMSLSHAEAPYFRTVIIECAICTVVSILDMIVGMVSEWLCQLPPREGPEHPKAIEAKRKRKLAQSPANKAFTKMHRH